MEYADNSTRLLKMDDGEYPVYYETVRKRNPTVGFPAIPSLTVLVSYGYTIVLLTPMPDGDVVTEAPPEEVDGRWYQRWNIRPFNEEELAAILIDEKARCDFDIELFHNDQFAIGFPYVFNEGEYHVQIRDGDRQNISSIRIMAKEAIAEATPFSVIFRVYENVSVTMTAAEFVEMADTAYARVTEGYQVVWDLKDQCQNATTPSELPTMPEHMFEPTATFRR